MEGTFAIHFFLKGRIRVRKFMLASSIVATLMLISAPTIKGSATACDPTGFQGLTAAYINPGDINGGTYDGTGCDIVIYYGAGADNSVKNAFIANAKRFGVLVNGDAGAAAVDIIDSQINQIGDQPFTGNQYGVGIYYRAFFAAGSATGRVSGNTIGLYQKGGIVVNGPGSNVQVQENTVEGLGQVPYIAQNGIQFGFGGSGSAMKNKVSLNQYTGTSTYSSGILVVGGPGWSAVFGAQSPDGSPWQYSTGVQIVKNTVSDNDGGVILENYAAGFEAPGDPTNIKVVNNTISNSVCFTNPIYQVGVADVGNNDKIIANTISGAGILGCNTTYNPSGLPVDADESFTNRPKVHATK
jgi:hypothetical protein